MDTDDDAIRHYMALNPWRFNELVSLEIHQQAPRITNSQGFTVRIILRPSDDTTPTRLHLVFYHVVDMRLNPGGYMQLMQTEIISIRDREWEQLNYLVHETEDDVMRFYCHHFEARLAPANDEEDEEE